MSEYIVPLVVGAGLVFGCYLAYMMSIGLGLQ